jgi:hypothetical protein
MRYAGLTLASSSNEAAGPLSLQDRFNKVRNRPHPFKRFTPLHSGVGVPASKAGSSIRAKKDTEIAFEGSGTMPVT